jgi:ABC-2 type transport system ATP-binding protein
MTPMTTPVLQVDDVVKDYRSGVRANDGISLEVAAGEVFGLLGHNGAGKTTLLNQVVGIAKPTSGGIRIQGRDAVADPPMARRICSMQPQAQAPLAGVTPEESIELMARIRGASRYRARKRTSELIEALDIGGWARTKGERLSGGVQRLTAFAMAVAQPGKLVMLDEPTNDVDPVRRRLLWEEVRQLAGAGCAVVLVTHNVLEAERAVDRLVILDEGRVVAHGTPTQLRGDHGGQLRMEVVAVRAEDAHAIAERAVTGQVPGTQAPLLAGRRVMVPIDVDAAAEALAWAQEEQRAGTIDEFAFNPVSLEDIYIRLVGTENDRSEEADDASLDT